MEPLSPPSLTDTITVVPGPIVAPTLTVLRREPPATAAHVPVLAQDAFISRSFVLNHPADVGGGVDSGIRAAAAIATDIQGLRQDDLPIGTRLALTGKLLRDTGRIVTSGKQAADGIVLTHQHLVARSGLYGRAQSVIGKPVQKLYQLAGRPNLRPVLSRIEQVGAIGSLGLATVALPATMGAAFTRTTHAVGVLRKPGSTSQERLTAVRDAAYTDATLIYTAAAVPSAIQTVATAGTGKARSLRRMATQVTKKKGFATAERVSKRAMPVADSILLAADGIHLYQTMKHPHATRTQKALASVNVSLDVTKLALHACPQTRGVRVAYSVASIAQLGLTLKTLRKP